MVKIRLKRFGAAKRPTYRIVIVDASKPRNGECIEEVGTYAPIEVEGKQVAFKEDRIKYWLGVGAQPTDIVSKLLNKTAKTK